MRKYCVVKAIDPCAMGDVKGQETLTVGKEYEAVIHVGQYVLTDDAGDIHHFDLYNKFVELVE
jgi:hypothetical protein